MEVIYEFLSAVGDWLFLAWVFNVILTIILIVFLIRVPKALAKISFTLSMIYQNGINTGEIPQMPVYDDDRDDPNS